MHYPLTWSNEFCGGRGKIGASIEKVKGPMANKMILSFLFNEIFFGEKR
jgi:hypothetical protein